MKPREVDGLLPGWAAFQDLLRRIQEGLTSKKKDGWLKSSQFVQLSAAPQLQPSDITSYGRAGLLM
ncbi:MAG TPA: hypothetical protein VIW23_01685 [Candidatus Acidoferrum sp.]|jgi:hypothetical protein